MVKAADTQKINVNVPLELYQKIVRKQMKMQGNNLTIPINLTKAVIEILERGLKE